MKTARSSRSILRTTESVCPKCSAPLPATIVADEEGVFMEKRCPQHGDFRVRLSATPDLYAELDGFYCSLMGQAQPCFDYEIWPTLRCNMNCAICFFGCPRESSVLLEPTLHAIEEFVRQDTHPFYCLSGAEATVRDDLPDIIRVLKKHRKAVTLNTNGARFGDESYLLKLKDAGLDRVILQCDGFDSRVSLVMRGVDVVSQREHVLALLEKHRMPTALSSTIARGLNEHTVSELLDYALAHPFINGIAFLSIAFDGGARNWSQERYMMPDEVIDVVCRVPGYNVRKENVHRFQKLHFAIKAFLKHRACLYNQLYVLVRRRGSFEPIDAFVNLAKAEPWLDRYRHAYTGKKHGLGAVYLGLAVLCLCCHRRILVLARELIGSGLSYFFRTSRYLRTSRLLALSFTTSCDPYKLDKTILQNCQNEIMAADQTPDSLRPIGREGAYFVNLEKRHCESKNRGKP